MDRSSGSGVFARDPDALIDLVELELTDDLMKQQEGSAATSIYSKAIQEANFDYFDENVGIDDQQSVSQMNNHAKRVLDPNKLSQVEFEIDRAIKRVKMRSAWRVEGTLREYPKFDAVNMWFQYPVHNVDDTGILKDIQPEAEQPAWKKNFQKKKSPADKKKEQNESLETAYGACSIDGNVTLDSLSEFMGVTPKTVRNRIKNHGGFWITDGEVGRKPDK